MLMKSSFHRAFQNIWDRNLENKDIDADIIVLGRKYTLEKETAEINNTDKLVASQHSELEPNQHENNNGDITEPHTTETPTQLSDKPEPKTSNSDNVLENEDKTANKVLDTKSDDQLENKSDISLDASTNIGESTTSETQFSFFNIDDKFNDIKNLINDSATAFSTWQNRYLHDKSTPSIECLPPHSNSSTESSFLLDSTHLSTWPEGFLKDLETRIWLTYRTDFPLIEKEKDSPSGISFSSIFRGGVNFNSNGFSSDCGWGCMIRTSQSLVANALLDLHIGRDWRYIANDTDNINYNKHVNIVSWFEDSPSAPFSIHNFVDQGNKKSNKKPGQWFGPSAASKSIEAICKNFPEAGLKVYISASNGDIYDDELLKLAYEDNKDIFSPILILAGIRLGVKNVNSLYWNSLKCSLSLPQSVGIAGGRPASSHYFFGYQEDSLFYLDPHVAQKALVPPVSAGQEVIEETINKDTPSSQFIKIETPQIDIASVHTKRIRMLPLVEMDPSMLVGILVKSREDYDQLKTKFENAEGYQILYFHKNKPNIIQNRTSISHELCGDDDDDDFVDIGFDDQDEAIIQDNSSQKFDMIDMDTENSIIHDTGVPLKKEENNTDSFDSMNEDKSFVNVPKAKERAVSQPVIITHEEAQDLINDRTLSATPETFETIDKTAVSKSQETSNKKLEDEPILLDKNGDIV
ncbi:hypothetical protein B5S29_g1074 [[Candida] boidinii]|nr:hypothetical protein B5S29_g1074 [[Candida] boidinii]